MPRPATCGVVIETLKGSRNKCDYEPDCDCLALGTVLPEGMTFPFDFVASTLGDDGDPLDIRARLVGGTRC